MGWLDRFFSRRVLSGRQAVWGLIIAMVAGAAVGFLSTLIPTSSEPGSALPATTVAIFGLLFVFQGALLSRFWSQLAFTRSLETSKKLERSTHLSYWWGWAGTFMICAITALMFHNRDGSEAAVFIWLGLSLGFLLFVHSVALEQWERRTDLERELAAYIVGLNILGVLTFATLTVLGIEKIWKAVDGFTNEVANTVIIAATVMSIPPAAWVLFLLRQTPPSPIAPANAPIDFDAPEALFTFTSEIFGLPEFEVPPSKETIVPPTTTELEANSTA
jgi:xanthosine utilization system XapX-like protein